MSGGARPAVVAAAVGSAVAGLVHGAAAGTHQGDSLLVWMFSRVCCRPTRLGLGGGGCAAPSTIASPHWSRHQWGAVLVWAASRTVGISFINSLKVPEEVGTQDLTSALFAALSVAAIVCLLVRPEVRAVFPPSWAGSCRGVRVLARDACIGRRAHAPSRSPRSRDHGRRGGRREPQPTNAAADDHSHTERRARRRGGHDHVSLRAPHQRTGTTTERRRA